MHEASLAQEVIRIVEQTAVAEHFQQIKSLNIEVGQLSCVEPQALRFAINALAPNTIVENAAVNILLVTGRLCCRHCATEFNSATVYNLCPCCQRSGARIVAGDDMQVTQIEVCEVQHV